ncbi:MAG: N-acetyltransferase [Candidatus Bathyarchaeia archaeon]
MVYLEEFQVRSFTPSDLSSVMEINRRCLPENYSPSFFLEIYRNCPEGFLIAQAGPATVGYVMCRLEYGFSELNRLKMVKKGHLVSIAVLEGFRRMGIGLRLLTQALNGLSSRGARECYLEVRTANLPGIELYRKMGFTVTRRIPAYYHDGSDAYIMVRQI